MLYTRDFQPLDEIAHGFSVEIAPEIVCRQLWQSASRPSRAISHKTSHEGGRYVASFTDSGLFRVEKEKAAVKTKAALKCGEGAGTELERLIRFAFRMSPIESCGCKATACKMNLEGNSWCRENLEWIVDRMREGYDSIKAQFERSKKPMPKVLLLPFVKMVARSLAKTAIRRAERALMRGKHSD